MGADEAPPFLTTFVERRTTGVSIADGPVVGGGTLAAFLEAARGARDGLARDAGRKARGRKAELAITISDAVASGRRVTFVTLGCGGAAASWNGFVMPCSRRLSPGIVRTAYGAAPAALMNCSMSVSS